LQSIDFVPKIIGYKDYVTRAGDTFDQLALAMYNEEKLSHYISEFNPDYSDVIVFGSNVPLRLPIVENAELPGTLPLWRRDK